MSTLRKSCQINSCRISLILFSYKHFIKVFKLFNLVLSVIHLNRNLWKKVPPSPLKTPIVIITLVNFEIPYLLIHKESQHTSSCKVVVFCVICKTTKFQTDPQIGERVIKIWKFLVIVEVTNFCPVLLLLTYSPTVAPVHKIFGIFSIGERPTTHCSAILSIPRPTRTYYHHHTHSSNSNNKVPTRYHQNILEAHISTNISWILVILVSVESKFSRLSFDILGSVDRRCAGALFPDGNFIYFIYIFIVN